ncbi:hypothetical protein Ddye_018002 [Dipteronia dyeriana]|uniref:Enoyl reductase (ER) domain-containing protein n=1 Tax=Dipteronia dyeriana TaxID=168575 RepID=A0AAD9UAE1_9ROSI|nr:hypothetical protein Ddye_018002 [Dipteronia dyeriana]
MQKAWFYEEYGPKEVLHIGDFPIPTPQHNQLLIQVRAAALNPIDCKIRQRPIFTSDFPVVPGCDMAGIVLAKGSGVTKFNTGDENIFVVGGAGGVGTLVIQLAKHLYGASYVVATTSTPKVEFVKNLGVDEVIDYTKTVYEEIEEKYDFLYDTVGDCKNSFVVAKEDAPIVDITWPPSHPRAVYSSLTVSGENLEKLRSYLETGTGPYKFTDVIEAFRHLETGRARGKVVITGFPSQHIPPLKLCDNINNSLPPPEIVSQEMSVY